jgi:hypothetical protein
MLPELFKPTGTLFCHQNYVNQLGYLFLLLQVCGVGDKRPDNIWLAAEGVYHPVMPHK